MFAMFCSKYNCITSYQEIHLPSKHTIFDDIHYDYHMKDIIVTKKLTCFQETFFPLLTNHLLGTGDQE